MSRFTTTLAALALVLGSAAPAMADEAGDLAATTQGLVTDTYSATTLLLQSLDGLEKVAGDADTQMLVTKTLTELKAAKPTDPGLLKAFQPKLQAIGSAFEKGGVKAHAFTKPELETLKTAILNGNASVMMAKNQGSRAFDLSKQAGVMMMSNPFGAMALKPLAEQANDVVSFANTEAGVAKQVIGVLSKLANASDTSIMPTPEEIQNLVKSYTAQ